mgnify:CR=1 FL=1
MLIHVGKNRNVAIDLRLAVWLSLVAGAVNAAGITATGSTAINVGAVAIDSRGGDVDFAGQDIAINPGATIQSTSGSNTVTLRGDDLTDTIGIGAGAGASTVALAEAELDTIGIGAGGITTIIIGSTGQTGEVTIDDDSAFDLANTSLTIYANGTNGQFTQTSDTAISLTSSGKALTIHGGAGGTNRSIAEAAEVLNGGSFPTGPLLGEVVDLGGIDHAMDLLNRTADRDAVRAVLVHHH